MSNVRIANLDGLRAIAVAFVVVAHYAPSEFPISRLGVAFGLVGVHLFFVLSGYLITGILLDRYQTVSTWRGFATFWTSLYFALCRLCSSFSCS